MAWISIVAIALCCLLASAFISGSEIAFFGLTPHDIDDLRDEESDRKCAQAYNLISHSERLLATILIANNLVNITMVVLLTFAINQTVHFNSGVLNFLVQTVFLTFLLLLFGEIFPKLVARGRTRKWACMAAPALCVLYNLFKPLSGIMVRSTSLIGRIVTKKHEAISTEELGTALEISNVKEGQEKEMLEGILSFGEKEVSDIMIARVDVTDIDYHATWTQAVETALKSGYSRIPVYDTSQDIIRGVLYAKDMLPYIGKRDDSFEWQKLIREAFFVPGSRMIDDLLEDFRKSHVHIAIVIDEYGGTQGIVTLEDVIEEIVGDIDDEYDEEEKLYRRIGPDTYVFEGKTPLTDFCRITGVDEEEFDEFDDDAETLAGLILAVKGDFPRLRETITTGRFRFQILGIEKHRITSVWVRIQPETEEDSRDKK